MPRGAFELRCASARVITGPHVIPQRLRIYLARIESMNTPTTLAPTHIWYSFDMITHALPRSRAVRRSSFARPCICGLTSLSLVLWPSVCPFDQGCRPGRLAPQGCALRVARADPRGCASERCRAFPNRSASSAKAGVESVTPKDSPCLQIWNGDCAEVHEVHTVCIDAEIAIEPDRIDEPHCRSVAVTEEHTSRLCGSIMRRRSNSMAASKGSTRSSACLVHPGREVRARLASRSSTRISPLAAPP
jgi:hypothetical protein